MTAAVLMRRSRVLPLLAFVLWAGTGCAKLGLPYPEALFLETKAKGSYSPEPLPSGGPVGTGFFRELAVGDLDGDGSPEIVSANFLTGEISIWRGRKRKGEAGLAVLRTSADVRVLRLADVDGDARLDIVAALQGKGRSGIHIWLNMGELRFRKAPVVGRGQTFYDIVVEDLNFDGRADLAAVWAEGEERGGIRVWLNMGRNRWHPAPAPSDTGPFLGVAAADINQDGAIDLLAAGRGPKGGLRAWLGQRNSGRWGKTNILALGDFWSVSALDLNGDGILDIIATGRETGIRIWQGLGRGNLNLMASPISLGSFWQAVPIDRDGDGRIDLVANPMNGGGLHFWKQVEGLGWVAQRRVLPDRGRYRSLLVADFDADGRPDLGAASHGQGIAVWPGFGKPFPPPEKGKPERRAHNLPLIPGTRMPETASTKRLPEGNGHAPVNGARPQDRLPGEYVIGPGDTLAITIWRGIDSEIRKVRVSERGLISFGYLDDARAAGLTLKELDGTLTARLARFIKNPRIQVSIEQYGSKVVRVMGSVVRPKTYHVERSITLLDAILLAGGHITPTSRGDLERVKLQREGVTKTVNLIRFISGGNGSTENPLLRDGDLVFVPEASPDLVDQRRVYVFGQARKPGVYPFTSHMTVLDAVARAGGFTNFGLRHEVRVIRGDPERPEVILADIKGMLERGDTRGNHPLRPNDVVYIPRSIIGDVNEFIRQVSPILDFLFYPARFREAYALNTNVLRFDLGGPSLRKAERESEGTFRAGTASTSIVLR